MKKTAFMSCTYKQSSCCLPTEERKCFFKQQINNFGYIFLWESYSPLFISGRQQQCDGRQKMTDYGWLKQEKIKFFVIFCRFSWMQTDSPTVLPESLRKKQPNFRKPQNTYTNSVLKTLNNFFKALSKGKNIFIKA